MPKPWEKYQAAAPWEKYAKAPAASEPEAISKLESFGRGGGQGVTLGFQDELSGATEPGIDLLLDKLTGKSGEEAVSNLPEKSYKERRNEYRAENHAAHEANPWSYGAGEVAGGALVTAPIAAPATLASAIGTGAGVGAVGGLGTGEREGANMLIDAGEGALAGGAGGALGYGAGKAIESGSQKVRNYLMDLSRKRALKSYGIERGTTKKLLGKNIDQSNLDDLGDRLFENKMITPFGNTEDMVSKAKNLEDAGWDQMKGVYDTADEAMGTVKRDPFTNDPVRGGHISSYDIGLDLQNVLSDFDDDIAKKVFDTYQKKLPVRPGEKMTLSQVQDLKNSLNQMSNWKSLSPSPMDRAFQKVERTLSDNILKQSENAASTLGEEFGEGLSQGRSMYRTAQQVKEPLLNKSARELGNKSIGLTDWILLAGGIGEEGGFKVPIVYGAKKYGEKYGNQQVALGARKFAHIMGNPKYTKFTKMLSEAAKRSPQALAATNYVLGQSSPEYREMISASEDSEL